MGGFGGLGAPLGLSGATFCSPGEQKESQKCSKDDLGDMLKPLISYVFLCVFEVRGPPGDPNDGLEAVSNPTWSTSGPRSAVEGGKWWLRRKVCGRGGAQRRGGRLRLASLQGSLLSTGLRISLIE